MDSTERSASTVVARLVVAAVALSSLAAGTTIAGSVIEVVAPASASEESHTPAVA